MIRFQQINKGFLILVFGLLLGSNNLLFGQIENITVGSDYNNLPWEEFVNRLEKSHPIRVFYEPDSIPDFKVLVSSDSSSLKQVLEYNLKPLNISAAFDKNGNVFILLLI